MPRDSPDTGAGGGSACGGDPRGWKADSTMVPLPGFLDHYNYRRPHRALDRQTPIQRLAGRNNLARTYT